MDDPNESDGTPPLVIDEEITNKPVGPYNSVQEMRDTSHFIEPSEQCYYGDEPHLSVPWYYDVNLILYQQNPEGDRISPAKNSKYPRRSGRARKYHLSIDSFFVDDYYKCHHCTEFKQADIVALKDHLINHHNFKGQKSPQAI